MQLDRLALAGSRVPRYTSYPTAAQFDDGVGPADVARWLGELDPCEPASLYLHVPFCRRLCLYCGCNTAITARQAPLDRYVEALLREIDLVASRIPGRLAISHLHFGGGTPTILEPGALGAVMDALRARFEVLPRAEVATEIDPRGLDDARIRMLAATGFTRVSLGVQDLDPGVQAAIDRIQPRDLVARAVDRLRAAGLARISMDLIYGLPRQDEGTIARSAEAVAEMGPDRVALFGYAHVPWMKPHQRLLEPAGLPGASQRLALCDAATGVLLASGYDAIGIDHFALPGDELARAAREGTMRRNFQGYTTDAAAALLGLGASAIGSFGQGHAQNATRVDAWGAAIAGGRLPTARGVRIDAADRRRARIIERLMCQFEADVADDLAEDPGLAGILDGLAPLEAAGLAIRRGARVTIPEAARPFARVVAARFDAYLPAEATRHAAAV